MYEPWILHSWQGSCRYQHHWQPFRWWHRDRWKLPRARIQWNGNTCRWIQLNPQDTLRFFWSKRKWFSWNQTLKRITLLTWQHAGNGAVSAAGSHHVLGPMVSIDKGNAAIIARVISEGVAILVQHCLSSAFKNINITIRSTISPEKLKWVKAGPI